MCLVSCKLKSIELMCSGWNILQTHYNKKGMERCTWRKKAWGNHPYTMMKMTMLKRCPTYKSAFHWKLVTACWRDIRLIRVLFIESWLLPHTRVLSKRGILHMVYQTSRNIHWIKNLFDRINIRNVETREVNQMLTQNTDDVILVNSIRVIVNM